MIEPAEIEINIDEQPAEITKNSSEDGRNLFKNMVFEFLIKIYMDTDQKILNELQIEAQTFFKYVKAETARIKSINKKSKINIRFYPYFFNLLLSVCNQYYEKFIKNCENQGGGQEEIRKEER